jgi:excisionase family DNA binding protein
MDRLANPLSFGDALAALGELPRLLSVEQAADALSVSATTIRRRIQTGQLRAVKTSAGHGGRLRVLKYDLARLLSEMGA